MFLRIASVSNWDRIGKIEKINKSKDLMLVLLRKCAVICDK